MRERRGPRRGLAALGIAIAVWLGVGAYYLWSVPAGLRGYMVGLGSGAGEAQIGGPFTLIDQDGRPRSNSAFRGQLMLVFFGYTHCPDVCPTTLQAVTDALESFGEQGDLVRPIFITVDPARDMVERLKAFAANFHPRLVALTGTEDDIARVAKAYRVYYKKAQAQPGQAPDAGDYLMDHGAFIFLMGADGRYIAHFSATATATADEIAGGLKKYL